MDSSQWPQVYESTRPTNKKPILVRPNKEQAALNCPRCNSSHTKFCYYNNYSLSQPRHLCKTCKRYWTEGGNLRNVPVGGGSRKNKRPSTSKKPIVEPPQNPSPKTLNLGFNSSVNCGGSSGFGVLPFGLDLKHPNHQNPNLGSSSVSESIAFSSLMPVPASNLNPNPISVFSSSSFGDFKPNLSFSVLGHGYGNDLEENPMATSSSRVGFSFDPFSTSGDQQFDQNGKGQGGSNGSYWHGMIGGGSW